MNIESIELLSQFPEAITAGLLAAVTCSLLGVFVILKRMVFIGITLSETAACGVALAFMMHWPPFAGAAMLTLGTVAALAYPFESSRIPRDAILGTVFLLAAAGSILIVSKSGFGMVEVKSLLYGDLILAGAADIRVLLLVLLPVLAGFLLFLRPLFYTFLDREAMRVMGGKPAVWEILFFLALGLTISATSRITGPILVFCYLLVPPATALIISRRLPIVLLLSGIFGAAGTMLGILVSFQYDLPTNQTICVAACGILGVAAILTAFCHKIISH